MKKRQVVLKRNDSSRNSVNSSLTVRTVRYAECQKNHAASVGGYAVDGCREFMPSGGEGTDDALTCAACGCHRNFHRRELVKGLSPKEMTGEEPKALKKTTEKDEA
ncbi:unnamed protein product [Fraxinus pennsylvanica]|uniref:ZF-HD dimerization-type domain-containing protein n=1 Tax=Fraxinus pennsylvanica TaxID=56036 RepID=A0AAD1YZJ4_9LAMI|nr:unnamed protein product [Fraxinus pennsylvanica]